MNKANGFRTWWLDYTQSETLINLDVGQITRHCLLRTFLKFVFAHFWHSGENIAEFIQIEVFSCLSFYLYQLLSISSEIVASGCPFCKSPLFRSPGAPCVVDLNLEFIPLLLLESLDCLGKSLSFRRKPLPLLM
jgi:hypothetical protein